jgi:hypothetical protein
MQHVFYVIPESITHHAQPCPPPVRRPKDYLLHRRLLQLGLASRTFTPAPPDADTLCLAHDPAYVAAFMQGSIDPAAMRRIGLPWSPDLVRRTLIGVGSAVLAARLALQYGVAAMCNGGTHHAHRDHGSGEAGCHGRLPPLLPPIRAGVSVHSMHQATPTQHMLLPPPPNTKRRLVRVQRPGRGGALRAARCGGGTHHACGPRRAPGGAGVCVCVGGGGGRVAGPPGF